MANNGPLPMTQGDIRSVILHVTVTDSDHLLDGYAMYFVFDSGEQFEAENSELRILDEWLNKPMLTFQLKFVKDGKRFYSLNTAKLKLNKIIKGKGIIED